MGIASYDLSHICISFLSVSLFEISLDARLSSSELNDRICFH